ncbi:MAG: SelB C-terminal domain-containing protein, partial [Nocardioidaceae bacterium]
ALERLGVDTGGADGLAPAAGDWLLDPAHAATLHERLGQIVRAHDEEDPLDPGVPVAAAARALDLPTTRLVEVLAGPPLRIAAGRVLSGEPSGPPTAVRAAVGRLSEQLAGAPFSAPDAGRLAELGLDTRTVAAAAKAGLVLRLADSVLLLPGADGRAAELLSALPQPFTASQARTALGTTRRVVLPLLDHLDRTGLTVRLPDDRRTVPGHDL